VIELSVVVASHDRPLRLRWLLNALEEQTLERGRWEVVVAHDSAGPETDALLAAHALAADGTLRALSFPPGPGPAVKRNSGWRAARGDLVLFTDDDCRPPAGWLAGALEAARAHPGAIVQGATRPDPDELGLVRVGGWRSQEIEPPVPWAQTCNILYPRGALEVAGGFDETLPLAAGEDTDLALRAQEAGFRYEGAPGMLTYHAVEVLPLAARVREVQRWQHLPAMIRRHPQLRRHFPLGVFWKPRHAWMALALAGAALLARRAPLGALLLALPWARAAKPSYGPGARGRLRSVSELPALAVQDAAEMAALARGSVRYKTLFL
jgi:glycosyltransferase involved in cell wall biosynthesis